MKIDNWDDVFYIHSRNPYGNGTAIFTNNGATARKFQQEIDVGQVGTDIALYRVSQKKCPDVSNCHNSFKIGTRNKSRVSFEILRKSSC